MKEVIGMIDIKAEKVLKVASVVCSIGALAMNLAGNVIGGKLETIKIEKAVENYMKNR